MFPDVTILGKTSGKTECVVEIGYTRPEKLTAYRRAALHEARHAVAFTWLGREVTEVCVRRRKGAWLGFTEDPMAGRDFTRARFTIAGALSEKLSDPDFRDGSSINEIVLFNALCSRISHATGADMVKVQARAMGTVCSVLRRNEDAVHRIAHRLMKSKTLHVEEIASLLRGVEVGGKGS